MRSILAIVLVAAVTRVLAQQPDFDKVEIEVTRDFVTSDKFIETLYEDLSGGKAGGFVKHN